MYRAVAPPPVGMGWRPGIAAPVWNSRLTYHLARGLKLARFSSSTNVGVFHLMVSVIRGPRG